MEHTSVKFGNMTERCYLHTEDLHKLSNSAASHLGYENVTLYDAWGRPTGTGKQYYRDCDAGCCWYVPDYCCDVSSSDLVTRVVAVVVTLVIVTIAIVVTLCGGVILARRRGQIPWLRRRQQHQQQRQPCLIRDCASVGSGSLLQQQQQQLCFQGPLPSPPPYETLSRSSSCEEERSFHILGLPVTTPKPPEYDQLGVVMTSQGYDFSSLTSCPPPCYSASSDSSYVCNELPPTYDEAVPSPPTSHIQSTATSSPASSTAPHIPNPGLDINHNRRTDV